MISIFAKRAFLNTNPSQEFISKEESYKGHGHLQRVSSMIRADQIAEKIGAKLNPTEGYENDICIYVKPHVKKGQDFKFEGRKAYLDIIDGHTLADLAKKDKNIGVIVCSEVDYEIMKQELPDNEIVLIPQHHCNFERKKRTRTEIKRVGIIGEKKAENWFPKNLEKELNKRGLELVFFYDFFSKEDIVNFYMSIDLQIVWRPYKKILSNPLKIVNAASFGIPTIALDEKAFSEIEGCYIGVENLEEFLQELDMLRSVTLYQIYSDRCIVKAEEYHIDNIAKLYKQL